MDDRAETLGFDDVRAAAARLAGIAHRTPVLRSRTLDALAGCQVFLKAENLQRMGAFKFRGAYNALAQLTPEERARGVFAFSSGNHAQAVALAARILGLRATILMPEDAPANKLAATRGYGAEVITYDRYKQDREALAQALAAERGALLVPPYDDLRVMAGAGSCGLEIAEDVPELDALVVCCGGGGFLSGCIVGAQGVQPRIACWGAEPEAGDDARQSLARGAVVRIEVPKTICDGQQTQALGRRPWAVIGQRAAGVLTASDAQVVEAMRFAFERLKLVLEPSGACALAALLAARERFAGQRVAVTLSGGNIDTARFAALMAAGA
jgi:threonine dehydratase